MRLRTYFLATAAVLLSYGCGGSLNSVSATSGTFVGTTSDPSVSVVIVAAPSSGASSRSIHAYVSDGVTLSEFFSGTASGNIFDLTNADGEVSGTIDSFGAAGTVTISSSSLSFSTSRSSTGVGGLYSITVNMIGGTVSGSSADGASLTGVIGTTAIGDSFQVAGTISPAGGGADVPFSALITQDSDGLQRWIIADDGSIRGGGSSGGTGFVTSEV
jgi:hypothetical protein